jgi:peroxiredoxin
MKKLALAAPLFFVFGTAFAAVPQQTIIVATTGEPVPLEEGGAVWERRGTVRVDGREFGFVLEGPAGIYNEVKNRVRFDLDGNGRFDLGSELYTVEDKYVTLGSASFEFLVDRFGRSLTLLPRSEVTASGLTVGSPAPDFSFRDREGRSRHLSDYLGKVVLLGFWSTDCEACVRAAPKLAGLYSSLQERGFEVVGISEAGERSYRTPWPQVVEGEDRKLGKLYGIDRMPTYFLIGRDGTIRAVDAEIRADEGALTRLLEQNL